MEATKLSAGAVVVRRGPGGHRYLLLRAYRNWDFPKGIVEPGEEPLEAARREVREETGIADLAFPWGEGHVETAPYGRGKVARFYLAETATEAVDLGANPSGVREHHEHRWLPFGEARALLVERLRAVLDWAEARVAAEPRPGAGLASIGRPAAANADVVDLLEECHGRIRSFLAIARRIAEARNVAEAEIADAAARVHRYFAEALPLHARDEEESVLPRLRGLDPAVDEALDVMHREHVEHEGALGRLLRACAALAAAPASLDPVRPELEAAVSELDAQFGRHLEREERVVFPALRRLDAPARARMAEELRARRVPPR